MMKTPNCKNCGREGHYKTFCPALKRPPIKTKKRLNKIGKVGEAWISARVEWIIAHPAPDDIWYCHYCKVPLVLSESHWLYQAGHAMILTLDHIKPRGSNPKLRFAMDNLIPCCGPDNVLKGSQDYARFVERWYPHLVT